jgi:hypothetical protein
MIGLLGVLVAGCATTQVESRLSEDWQGALVHVFVIAEVGSHWAEQDVQALRVKLAEDLGQHCPRVDVRVIGGLELEPPDFTDEVASSGAPHLLLLSQTAAKRRLQGFGTSTPAGFMFDARLLRVADRAVLWRASLDTGGSMSTQEGFAGSMVGHLVDRMLDDGLLIRGRGDPLRSRPARATGADDAFDDEF